MRFFPGCEVTLPRANCSRAPAQPVCRHAGSWAAQERVEKTADELIRISELKDI